MLAVAAFLGWGRAGAQTTPPPSFIVHEIATGLRGGYQTIAADLNKDGRLDLIAVASSIPELLWFENPTWTRHVLAAGLTGLINVAARDLDADGIPEIAVAHGFSTNPARSIGNVSLLTHGPDPRQPWSIREIDRVPTAHRLRWITVGQQPLLVNAPLAAANSTSPNYAGATPIYAYRAPSWTREVVASGDSGVIHGIEAIRWQPREPEVFLSAGFTGIVQHRFSGNAWERTVLSPGNHEPTPRGGSSDVGVGRLNDALFLAAIEPWHGNQVVVYRGRGTEWQRRLIDSTVTDGHTIVVADLDGDRRDEIIVGQRGGARSLWIYTASVNGESWSRTTLDEGGMAGAGCIAADLNGDGRIDIACIGTATANLKWYENTVRR